MEPKGKGLECLLCTLRYSDRDVLDGLYWIDTMVCSKCYTRMQRMPYEESCFGKPCVMRDGKVVQYGYNRNAVECDSLCPDRRQCASLNWQKV